MQKDLEKNNPRSSKRILITAGATREYIDPVRFISNRSTGFMGYSIASRGAANGYNVCLISGPTSLPQPDGVEFVPVISAREMRDEVVKRADGYDCLIMTAAVCDFRPEIESQQKIKKKEGLKVNLISNPDILLELSGKEQLIKVGFALETEDVTDNGTLKLKNKKLDLMIANIINTENDPFGGGTKQYVMIEKNGNISEINDVTKEDMAGIIINKVGELL